MPKLIERNYYNYFSESELVAHQLSEFEMIRVVLPFHLRNLAKVEGEVVLDVDGQRPLTPRAVLDALEEKYPVLKGTIREHVTKERRAFLRYFVCGKDVSLESSDTPLPEEVAAGIEPFRVVGAIAGG